MANRQQLEAVAKAVEPLIPYRDAGNNGPIVELDSGGFVRLTAWNVAVAALEVADAN